MTSNQRFTSGGPNQNSYRLRAILFIWPLTVTLALAADLTVNSALRINGESEAAFCRGDFATAEQKAKVADDYFRENKTKSNQGIYGIDSASVIRERAKLGVIKPDHTLSVLVVYVKNTKVVHHNKQVQTTMQPGDIVATRTQLGVFRRYIEVLSRGRLTMDFKYLPLDDELFDLDSRTDATSTGSVEINKGGTQSMRKTLGNISVFNELVAHDVCILYWCDHGIGSNAYGTIEHIQAADGRTCNRGVIRMPIRFKWPGTLLHEYFHVVEDTYKITPRHGFFPEQRKAFPQWKGEGQYSYYYWQFQNILSNQDLSKLKLAR